MEMHTRESLKALLGIEPAYRPPFSLHDWLFGLWKRVQAAEARRRDYAILMEKSERELADIGLTRADVAAAWRHGRMPTRRDAWE